MASVHQIGKIKRDLKQVVCANNKCKVNSMLYICCYYYDEHLF